MNVNNRRHLPATLAISRHNLIRNADFAVRTIRFLPFSTTASARACAPQVPTFMQLSLCAAVIASSNLARADMRTGTATFASQRQCASSGKLSAETCATAHANAAAEFDEKAPRFSSRSACERVYGACALGFRGAAGWAGQHGAVYFTPQRHGFRVTVKSEHDATVVPVASGLSFAPRSAMRRDVTIHPKFSRDYSAAALGGASQTRVEFGSPTPEGAKGPLPPPPSVDPNFDCASVLEPSDTGDPNTGCYFAPGRRR